MNDIKTELTFTALRAIRRWTNTVEVYDFPFLDIGRIWIRVLTQDEIFRSSLFWKQEAKNEGAEDDVNVIINFTTRELLRKACFVGETDNKFFKSTDEVGELSVDETDALFDLYNRTQEKYAPAQSLETEKDFKDLISEIKKKISAWDVFKFIHAREASIFFSCTVSEITEGQWYWIWAAKEKQSDYEKEVSDKTTKGWEENTIGKKMNNLNFEKQVEEMRAKKNS